MHTHFILHDALWEAFTAQQSCVVTVDDVEHKIRVFSNVAKTTIKIDSTVWTMATQNMSKRSVNTKAIEAAAKKGDLGKITWIYLSRGDRTTEYKEMIESTQKKDSSIIHYCRRDCTTDPNTVIEEFDHVSPQVAPGEKEGESDKTPASTVIHQHTKGSTIMAQSILDQVRTGYAKTAAVLEDVDIVTSTNVSVTADSLTTFKGKFPIWGENAPMNAPPAELLEVTGGLKVGSMVIDEARAFLQIRSNSDSFGKTVDEADPADLMAQVEFTVSLPDAVLGIIDEHGEFFPHPVYEDDDMEFLRTRALQIYCKSPFKTPMDKITGEDNALRETLLRGGFVQAQVQNRGGAPREPRRKTLFHLQAPSNGGSTADQIRARQQNGLPLTELVLVGPRPVADRPTLDSGEVRPEFEDFLQSYTTNIHRVIGRLVAGEDLRTAGRLVTCITGVDPNVDGEGTATLYPLRATVSTLALAEQVGPTKWATRSLYLFPETQEAAPAPAV